MGWLRLFWITASVVALFTDQGSAWWRRRRRRCATHSCTWKWSTCSRTCGGGTRYPIKTGNEGACGSCNMPSGTRRCNNQCCKVNCNWNSWGSWQACSVSCGGGRQLRTRSKVGPSCRGADCPGPSTVSRVCNAQCCPVDCQWAAWSNVGDCSATCGGGLQRRERLLTVLSSCGGNPCEGSSTGSIECNSQCCPVDCVLELWGDWSTCTKSCGTGTQIRERGEAINAYCGGAQCEGPYSEVQDCNTQCCAYDCIWGEWSEWSDCTKTCGIGEIARNRNVTQLAECGGTDCVGKLCETEFCNAVCCPVDCHFGTWTAWAACDVTCGGGTQSRTRNLTVSEQCTIKICDGPLSEESACNTQCCPADCRFSPWSQWSSCTAKCGSTGTQYRERYVEQETQCGGVNCTGEFYETQSCNQFCFNQGSNLTDTGCECGTGWQGTCCELDINECDFVTCPDNSDCRNSDGSFECVCHQNYTKEGDVCIHYDKCKTGRHDCSNHAQCTMIDMDDFACECNPGFTGNGNVCVDFDECLIDEQPEGESSGSSSGESSGEETTVTEWYPICHEYADCINTEGSYICVCHHGYTGDGWFNCTDVDECAHAAMVSSAENSYTNSSGQFCSAYAACNNSAGGYECACLEGYFGDGKFCEEVNECEPEPCLNGGLCIDLVNKFKCQCLDGYEGPLCSQDIDECDVGISNCHSENGDCINIEGSYLCECKAGYEGDGVVCVDIDECALELHTCIDPFPICQNLPGSYACECRPGATDTPLKLG